MLPYVLIPLTIAIPLLTKVAVAAWITRPGSRRDADEFLRVFNNMRVVTWPWPRRESVAQDVAHDPIEADSDFRR